MSDSTIRDATPEDASAIHEVAAAAWHDAHAPIIGESETEDFLEEYYSIPALRNAVRNAKSIFLVADQGNVVGFVETGPTDNTGVWSVYRIYVRPEQYGRGVGTALLSAAESRLRDTDAERLRLVVMAGNDRAVGFYESREFERVDTRENAFGDLDVVYEKPLDDTA